MAERYHRLRVVEVVEETPDARSLSFEVPPELADRFAYRPGQFLTLRIPSDRTGSVARCYSLSSSPHGGARPTVTVKRTPDGYGSAWLHEHVECGSELDVLPPAGVFTPRSLDADLLCVAAGSGITPVMSIVRTALATGSGRVALVYANRDERSVIFADALAALGREHPDRFVAVHWLESVQGLPSEAALRELARPFAGREAFVCGPAPFMAAATGALAGLGVPHGRVHVERFSSLEGNPFEAPASRPAEPGGTAATVEVELDGAKHTVPWPAGTVLLDALLGAGLDAPFSCREGRCSACACVTVDGEVTMRHNEVLDDADLADGYILACQSFAAGDKLSITYE